MKFSTFAGSLAVLTFGLASSVSATNADIGGFTVDTSKAATDAQSVNGTTFTFGSAYSDVNVLGNSFGLFSGLDGIPGEAFEQVVNFGDGTHPLAAGTPNAYMDVIFGNGLTNNAGVDLYVFESGNSPFGGTFDNQNNLVVEDVTYDSPLNFMTEYVSFSSDGTAGSFIDGDLLGFISVNDLTPNEDNRAIGLYVYGLDLSDIGVSEGATVNNVWFGNSATVPVGISERAADPDILYAAQAVAPIPEPATWLMMLAGFAVTGAALKRRKGAALAA